MDRKAFISSLVRGGILGSMAVLAGVLLSRRQISLEKQCGINLQCKSCTRLKACEYPESLNERENEKG